MQLRLLFLAGAAPVIVAASQAVANNLTVTVGSTLTRTLTNIVYVSPKPGPYTNTSACSGPICLSQGGTTSSDLETLSLTSTTTNMITTVITPPDVSKTICQTSLLVTTVTVYPTPQSLPTFTPSSVNETPIMTLVNHTCSGNLSISYQPTASTSLTIHSPEHSSYTAFTVPPNSPLPVTNLTGTTTTTASTTSNGTAGSSLAPITATMSIFEGACGRLRPHPLLLFLVRLLALNTSVWGQETVHSRFYVYQTAANGLLPSGTSLSGPAAPNAVESPVQSDSINMMSNASSFSTTTTQVSQEINDAITTSANSNSIMASTNATPGTYSPWWTSVQNVTIVSAFTESVANANHTSEVYSTLTSTSTVSSTINFTSTMTMHMETTETMSTTTTVTMSTPFNGSSLGTSDTTSGAGLTVPHKEVGGLISAQITLWTVLILLHLQY